MPPKAKPVNNRFLRSTQHISHCEFKGGRTQRHIMCKCAVISAHIPIFYTMLTRNLRLELERGMANDLFLKVRKYPGRLPFHSFIYKHHQSPIINQVLRTHKASQLSGAGRWPVKCLRHKNKDLCLTLIKWKRSSKELFICNSCPGHPDSRKAETGRSLKFSRIVSSLS